MKKTINLLISILMIITLAGCTQENDNQKIKIAVLQYVQHTSLDTIRLSIMEELEAKGYGEDNVEILYQNAGGDASALKSACDQFKAKKADVIITIATPAAAAAAPYAKDIPIIFAAVEDPVAAKFMNDLNHPNQNMTGTSDKVQVDAIMDMARMMYPKTKTIGYLYSTSESNSKANLDKLETYAKANDLTIEKAGISSSADIQPALSTLLAKSDIIFSPTDNTVAKSMAQVSQMCKDAKKPMFTGADSMVKDGGLASYGINYETLGKETADMAIEVLEGKPCSDIPVKIYQEHLKLYINTTTAKAIGYHAIDTLKANYDVVEMK